MGRLTTLSSEETLEKSIRQGAMEYIIDFLKNKEKSPEMLKLLLELYREFK